MQKIEIKGKKYNPKNLQSSFEYWSKKYLDDLNKCQVRVRGKLTLQTINYYKNMFKVFHNYIVKNNINFLSVNTKSIERIIEDIQISGYKDKRLKKDKIPTKTYSDASLRLLIVSISRFYKYLVDNNVLEHNPIKGFTIKKANGEDEAKVRSKLLTTVEIESVIEYIKNSKIDDKTKLLDAIFIMLAFGIRVSELEKLNKKNFIIDEYGIRLQIPMSKGRANRITLCISTENENYIKEIVAKDRLIFNFNVIKVQIKRIAKALNIPQLSVHSFRHVFATTSLELGYSLEVVQEMLGHSSLITTERYAKVTGIKLLNEHSRIRLMRNNHILRPDNIIQEIFS